MKNSIQIFISNEAHYAYCAMFHTESKFVMDHIKWLFSLELRTMK